MAEYKCKTCGWFKQYDPPNKENYVGVGYCDRFPEHVRKSEDSRCGEHVALRQCAHVFRDLKQRIQTGYNCYNCYDYEFAGKKCMLCGFEVRMQDDRSL